jgi:hypothetical protein
MTDTEALAPGEWVTVMPEPPRQPQCKTCGVEQANWDCAGCGYEWASDEWVPQEQWIG